MEENFEPVARTRANYYTPGSPVQFVCVELLKGEISGEHAVCLTFKNISKVTLTALEIHFKCKGVDGIILCEDEFEYRDIAVKPGESFGMDDAVFVTQKAITSVDVSLKNVYNGKRVVHLDAIKRVRLPAPRRLSPELQKALEARMNRQGLKYMPQVFENGWYCACGAFHPKEEDTVYCTECGCDRILLQNALNTRARCPVGSTGAARSACRAGRAYPYHEQRGPGRGDPGHACPPPCGAGGLLCAAAGAGGSRRADPHPGCTELPACCPRGPAGRRGHPCDACRRAGRCPGTAARSGAAARG